MKIALKNNNTFWKNHEKICPDQLLKRLRNEETVPSSTALNEALIKGKNHTY